MIGYSAAAFGNQVVLIRTVDGGSDLATLDAMDAAYLHQALTEAIVKAMAAQALPRASVGYWGCA